MLVPQELTHRRHRPEARYPHQVGKEQKAPLDPRRQLGIIAHQQIVGHRIDMRQRRHARHEVAPAAGRVARQHLVAQLPHPIAAQKAHQLESHLGMGGAGRQRPRKPARPGDRLAPRGRGRRHHAKAQARCKIGDGIERPVAIDLHRHLAGEKGIEFALLEAALEGIDPFNPAQSVVDRDHKAQRRFDARIGQRAGAAIGAHKLPAVEPAVDIEPGVAEIGREAEAGHMAIGVALGQLDGVVLELAPVARRFGLAACVHQTGAFEQIFVVVERAVIGAVGNGEHPAVGAEAEAGLLPAGIEKAVGMHALDQRDQCSRQGQRRLAGIDFAQQFARRLQLPAWSPPGQARLQPRQRFSRFAKPTRRQRRHRVGRPTLFAQTLRDIIVEWQKRIAHRPFAHRKAVLLQHIGWASASNAAHQLLRIHATARPSRCHHFPAGVLGLEKAQRRHQTAIFGHAPDNQFCSERGGSHEERAQQEKRHAP